MCSSESFPKEFEKTTEVLPLSKNGLSSIQEFKDAEKDLHELEWLKKSGLTYEEIKLYQENKTGLLDQRKIESHVLKNKLDVIYSKIFSLASKGINSSDEDEQPSSSNGTPEKNLNKIQAKPISFYPEGHPMTNIKELENNLFGHLKSSILPITKRRKILRHLTRRKERILNQNIHINIRTIPNTSKVDRPGSLWDMKEIPQRRLKETAQKPILGPKKQTMYTLKDNKIVRLEPMNQERQEEYRAVDIVMPINDAEVQLLEGTKMSLDDIKKIERFKEYEPGIPSKVLYLKNFAPSVTQEQVSLLFNQFMLANGGPIDVRLMTGRMRGQAFVAFQSEEVAIQALEETNGTILSGRPVIVQFGRNTNRIQDNNG